MSGSLLLLVVDRGEAAAQRVANFMAADGWDVAYRCVEDDVALRSALADSRYDVALLNPSVPDQKTPALLATLRGSDRSLPVIALSDGLGERRVAELVRRGVHDVVSNERLDDLSDAITTCLTKRRAVQQTADDVEKADARIRVVLQQLPAVVWTMDDDLQLSSVMGSRSSLLIDPAAGMSAPRSEYRDALRGGSRSFEHEHNDAVYEVWVQPMRDGDGAIAGVVGCALDVSQRRELEHQIQAAQRMESVGRLAGGIAHDFNNVLTIIECYTKFLIDDLDPSSETREDIAAIQEASRRAASLVAQLLAYSRRQVQELEVLGVNDIVADVERMLTRALGEDIEIVTHLDSSLRLVKADRAQIEQVLLNLAVNARDAMPTGGKLVVETANVELTQDYAGSHLSVAPGLYSMIAVTDNGTGMTEEVCDRVFEPFFTTKQDAKGTGLGLSTVYGIVKQSRGNIWVYSEPGVGTTFKVYLPSVDEPPSRRMRALVAPADLRGTETVLLVEDDDALRAAAERTLTAYGYTVLAASNAEHALRLATRRAEPIELMLTDVVMPKMSGKELSVELHVVRPTMRVLFTSGYAEHAIVEQGVLETDTPFLPKPYTPEELITAVRRQLDASG